MPSDDEQPSTATGAMPSRSGSAAVACVVTAFRPSTQLPGNVEALLSQSNSVIVVDDGSGPGYESVLEIVAAAGADVVRLPVNSGIGTALNRGIDRARTDRGIRYILTVDQDSLLPPGYVDALLAGEAAARAAGLDPGLISPARIHGNPVMSRGSHNGISLGKEPIQSGLMITTEALDALGGFREELFIDLVDTEYYLRATSAGWPTILADAEFDHSLGTFVEAQVLSRPITFKAKPVRVRIAAPWRYYYIFRNRIHLAREYGWRHPAWLLAGCWADVRHLAIVTALAPGRITRLKEATAGLADGFRGRIGRKPRA